MEASELTALETHGTPPHVTCHERSRKRPLIRFNLVTALIFVAATAPAIGLYVTTVKICGKFYPDAPNAMLTGVLLTGVAVAALRRTTFVQTMIQIALTCSFLLALQELHAWAIMSYLWSGICTVGIIAILADLKSPGVASALGSRARRSVTFTVTTSIIHVLFFTVFLFINYQIREASGLFFFYEMLSPSPHASIDVPINGSNSLAAIAPLTPVFSPDDPSPYPVPLPAPEGALLHVPPFDASPGGPNGIDLDSSPQLEPSGRQTSGSTTSSEMSVPVRPGVDASGNGAIGGIGGSGGGDMMKSNVSTSHLKPSEDPSPKP